MPLSPYIPRPDVYDALMTSERVIRPGWASAGAFLAEAGVDGRLGRWQGLAERVLASHGAGHHGGDTASPSFRFDPVPMVIDHLEWPVLEAGIRQRVHLLEAFLDDAYGAQRLLADHALPASLVLGSAQFVRAAAGFRPTRWLTQAGFDVARDSTGQLVVLQDHTDVPIGMGFALAYRAVSTRLLSETMRSTAVLAASDWLGELQGALASVLAKSRGQRRTVVLASAGSPRFVDHALLATQLGYHLAEDLDIAVSGGRVVLRSLNGLEPIDGLLRCTADDVTDPLEITDSSGGVPGLVEAARRGSVAVANAIGSGLASTFALQAFLPSLCRRLLGEDLLLSNVATVWCGDEDGRRRVLSDLSSWVLHDTDSFRSRRVVASVFGDRMSADETAEWRSRILAEPRRYVAQEKIEFGTTPVTAAGVVRPGIALLRCFAVQGPTGVSVMPGGIGRVVDPSSPVVTQASPVGKDVWVSGETHVERQEAPIPRVILPQVDFGSSIPIRAAESMYWMGRNSERASTIARLATVTLNRLEPDPLLMELNNGVLVDVLSTALRAVSNGALHSTLDVNDSAAHTAHAGYLRAALSDALGHEVGSMQDSIERVVAAARTVRQFLSTSTWQILAPLPIDAAAAYVTVSKSGDIAVDELFGVAAGESLDRVTLALTAFSGLVNDSLVRGPGWRFLEIGRRIERALLVLGLVEVMLVPLPEEVEQAGYEMLLASCESLVAYRRRYRSHVVMSTVATALLADSENPRSVAFQIDELHRLVGGLPDRAGVAALRSGLATAKFASGVEIQSQDDVIQRVLTLRAAFLSFAGELPSLWFRGAELRSRRVKAARRP